MPSPGPPEGKAGDDDKGGLCPPAPVREAGGEAHSQNCHKSFFLPPPSSAPAPHPGPMRRRAGNLEIGQASGTVSSPTSRDRPKGRHQVGPSPGAPATLTLSRPHEVLRPQQDGGEQAGPAPEPTGRRPRREPGEERPGSGVTSPLWRSLQGHQVLKNSPQAQQKSNRTLKI